MRYCIYIYITRYMYIRHLFPGFFFGGWPVVVLRCTFVGFCHKKSMNCVNIMNLCDGKNLVNGYLISTWPGL